MTEEDEKSNDHKPGTVNTVGTKTKNSFKERILNVARNVTVEPSTILFLMGIYLAEVISQNFYIEKVCRVTLNYSDEICSTIMNQDVEDQNPIEMEVQQIVTTKLVWKTYITATVPCIPVLLVGSFSDKTGYKKIFFLIIVVGQFLLSINSIINVIFFRELSIEYLVFSEAIIEGIFGSWTFFSMMIYSYISTLTTLEERTFRMGLISFCITIAAPLGMGLSGIMLQNIGFLGSYSVITGLALLNLLYTSLVLKELEKTPEQKKLQGRSLAFKIRLFFNLANTIDTLRVIYKKGPNKRRLKMVIVLLTTILVFGPFFADQTIMYLYTRYKFNWNEVTFSFYKAYNNVLFTLGVVGSTTVFSKIFGWEDSVVGMIGVLSKIPAVLIFAFAPDRWFFYTGPLANMFQGTVLLIMRSISSKLVERDELGKVTSIYGVIESLAPLIYVPWGRIMNFYKTMQVPGSSVYGLKLAGSFSYYELPTFARIQAGWIVSDWFVIFDIIVQKLNLVIYGFFIYVI